MRSNQYTIFDTSPKEKRYFFFPKLIRIDFSLKSTFPKKFLISFIIVLFLFSSFTIGTYFKNGIRNSKPAFFMEPSNFFFGIFLGNNFNHEYVKSFFSKEIKFIFKFFSDNLIDEFKNFSVQLQTSDNAWNKTIQMVQYFLSNSNSGWFYQGIGNTYFHFDNFQVLIQQLLVEEGNPINTFIIKGNCLNDHDDFLDPKVGFLMSRYAADQIVKFKEYSDLPFEQRFVKFLEKYNKTLNQYSDNRFISFEKNKETKDYLINHKFNRIEICPTESSDSKKIRASIQPLNAMAIYNYEILFDYEQDSKLVGEDIFVYQKESGKICRVINKTEIERFRQKKMNFTNK